MAVNSDGYREVIGAAQGMKEDKQRLADLSAGAERTQADRRAALCGGTNA